MSTDDTNALSQDCQKYTNSRTVKDKKELLETINCKLDRQDIKTALYRNVKKNLQGEKKFSWKELEAKFSEFTRAEFEENVLNIDKRRRSKTPGRAPVCKTDCFAVWEKIITKANGSGSNPVLSVADVWPTVFVLCRAPELRETYFGPSLKLVSYIVEAWSKQQIQICMNKTHLREVVSLAFEDPGNTKTELLQLLGRVVTCDGFYLKNVDILIDKLESAINHKALDRERAERAILPVVNALFETAALDRRQAIATVGIALANKMISRICQLVRYPVKCDMQTSRNHTLLHDLWHNLLVLHCPDGVSTTAEGGLNSEKWKELLTEFYIDIMQTLSSCKALLLYGAKELQLSASCVDLLSRVILQVHAWGHDVSMVRGHSTFGNCTTALTHQRLPDEGPSRKRTRTAVETNWHSVLEALEAMKQQPDCKAMHRQPILQLMAHTVAVFGHRLSSMDVDYLFTQLTVYLQSAASTEPFLMDQIRSTIGSVCKYGSVQQGMWQSLSERALRLCQSQVGADSGYKMLETMVANDVLDRPCDVLESLADHLNGSRLASNASISLLSSLLLQCNFNENLKLNVGRYEFPPECFEKWRFRTGVIDWVLGRNYTDREVEGVPALDLPTDASAHNRNAVSVTRMVALLSAVCHQFPAQQRYQLSFERAVSDSKTSIETQLMEMLCIRSENPSKGVPQSDEYKSSLIHSLADYLVDRLYATVHDMVRYLTAPLQQRTIPITFPLVAAVMRHFGLLLGLQLVFRANDFDQIITEKLHRSLQEVCEYVVQKLGGKHMGHCIKALDQLLTEFAQHLPSLPVVSLPQQFLRNMLSPATDLQTASDSLSELSESQHTTPDLGDEETPRLTQNGHSNDQTVDIETKSKAARVMMALHKYSCPQVQGAIENAFCLKLEEHPNLDFAKLLIGHDDLNSLLLVESHVRKELLSCVSAAIGGGVKGEERTVADILFISSQTTLESDEEQKFRDIFVQIWQQDRVSGNDTLSPVRVRLIQCLSNLFHNNDSTIDWQFDHRTIGSVLVSRMCCSQREFALVLSSLLELGDVDLLVDSLNAVGRRLENLAEDGDVRWNAQLNAVVLIARVMRSASGAHLLPLCLLTLSKMCARGMHMDTFLKVQEREMPYVRKQLEANISYLLYNWCRDDGDWEFPAHELFESTFDDFLRTNLGGFVRVALLFDKGQQHLETLSRNTKKSIDDLIKESFPKVFALCLTDPNKDRTSKLLDKLSKLPDFKQLVKTAIPEIVTDLLSRVLSRDETKAFLGGDSLTSDQFSNACDSLVKQLNGRAFDDLFAKSNKGALVDVYSSLRELCDSGWVEPLLVIKRYSLLTKALLADHQLSAGYLGFCTRETALGVSRAFGLAIAHKIPDDHFLKLIEWWKIILEAFIDSATIAPQIARLLGCGLMVQNERSVLPRSFDAVVSVLSSCLVALARKNVESRFLLQVPLTEKKQAQQIYDGLVAFRVKLGLTDLLAELEWLISSGIDAVIFVSVGYLEYLDTLLTANGGANFELTTHQLARLWNVLDEIIKLNDHRQRMAAIVLARINDATDSNFLRSSRLMFVEEDVKLVVVKQLDKVLDSLSWDAARAAFGSLKTILSSKEAKNVIKENPQLEPLQDTAVTPSKKSKVIVDLPLESWEIQNWSYESWLQRVSCDLVKKVGQWEQLFGSLEPLCKRSVAFCERVLPYLVKYLINRAVSKEQWESRVNVLLAELVGQIGQSIPALPVIRLLLQTLFCLEKLGHLERGNERFSSSEGYFLWQDLKLEYGLLAQLAAVNGFDCAAIYFCHVQMEPIICRKSYEMVFEERENYCPLELYPSEKEAEKNTISRSLKSAYLSLKNSDALYGLGDDILIDLEVRKFIKTESKEWHKLAALCSQRDRQSTEFCQAFDAAGLSAALGKSEQYDKFKYECAWKLGQWQALDQPKHLEAHNFDQGAYGVLVAFHSGDLQLARDCLGAVQTNETLTVAQTTTNARKLDHLEHLSTMSRFGDLLANTENTEVVCQKAMEQLHNYNTMSETELLSLSTYLKARVGSAKDDRDKQRLAEVLSSAICIQVAQFRRAQHYEKALQILNDWDKRIESLTNNKSLYLKHKLEETKVLWNSNEEPLARTKLIELRDKLQEIPRTEREQNWHELYCRTEIQYGKWHGRTDRISEVDKLDMKIAQNRKLMAKAKLLMAEYSDRKYVRLSDYMRSSAYQEKKQISKDLKVSAVNVVSSINRNSSVNERRYARNVLSASRMDNEDLDKTEKSRDEAVMAAVEHYLNYLIYSTHNRDKCVFRIVSLWFDHNDDGQMSEKIAPIIMKCIKQIPTYKWLPVWPQLVARMSAKHDVLETLLSDTCVMHPFHTFFTVLTVSRSSKQDVRSRAATNFIGKNLLRSAKAAVFSDLKKLATLYAQLANNLPRANRQTGGVWRGGANFKGGMRNVVSLALVKANDLRAAPISKQTMKNSKKRPKSASRKITSTPILQNLRESRAVPVITASVKIDPTGNYKDIVTIGGFAPKYIEHDGNSHPYSVFCKGSDGAEYRQVVKANDDLRQDAYMQQVISLSNQLLSEQRNGHSMRGYMVVPLSDKDGVMEFCAGTDSLGNVLKGTYARYCAEDTPFPTAQRLMREFHDEGVRLIKAGKDGPTGQQRLENFRKACDKIKPVMRLAFYDRYTDPTDWYERTQAYIRSVAVTSMIGHMVGLGDRHVSNILFDQSSGEVVHIDFGIAFEAGRSLAVPELVPFRLTRNLVDAMGASGVRGTFTRSCQAVLEILRQHKDCFVAILSVLLHDPLLEWTLTEQAARKVQPGHTQCAQLSDQPKNQLAERALLHLQDRLDGREETDKEQMSAQRQVAHLISEATNPQHLAQIYYGWQPYL